MDSLAKMQGQKNCETTVRFLFENKIETMDRLPKMQGQKIVETTVRFSILKQN